MIHWIKSRIIFSLSFLIVGSCLSGGADRPRAASGDEVASQKEVRVTKGTWGGTSISMEVTDEGARIEYDCAHGTISQAVSTDTSGRFSAKGFHVRERGGPVREGDEHDKGIAVIYTGTVDGKNMKLKVTTDDGNLIGDFTLTLGKVARLHKCL